MIDTDMFSIRVQYALQLLADMEVLGCCNLGWLMERYSAELSFDTDVVKKVAARLALWGIIRYEPGTEGENLYLTVSPDKIGMYALASAIDRKIDFGDLDAGPIPCPDKRLKKLTVQSLIDAGHMIRATAVRQPAAERSRLAVELDRKREYGEFMPFSHSDAAAILDGQTRRAIPAQRHIARFREVTERPEPTGKVR